jgi:hypothetical protein
MSSQFVRLQESLYRAHPTTLNQRIEVFANDLNAILEHYVAVSTQSAHDTALLRQALEALTAISGDVCNYVHHAKKDQHPYGEVCPVHVRHDQAIAALRERLKP